MNRLCRSMIAVLWSVSAAITAANDQAAVSIENDSLLVTLNTSDASLTVTDKRIAMPWRQQVTPGFQVVATSVKRLPTTLSAEVQGKGGPYLLTLALTPDSPHGVDVTLDIPGRKYTAPPPYPFPFAAPQDGWFYVQNTTGEGMLMPLAKPEEIKDLYQWNGGQPWWGLTDLKRGMSARLDSFRSQAARATIYAVPMKIHYDFCGDGGYQRLAKEYRRFFLRSNPEMSKLAERTTKRPAVASLKDSVYVYLWGSSPAEDLDLVREMKAAPASSAVSPSLMAGTKSIERCSTASKSWAGSPACTACRPATCFRSRSAAAGRPTSCSAALRLTACLHKAI